MKLRCSEAYAKHPDVSSPTWARETKDLLAFLAFPRSWIEIDEWKERHGLGDTDVTMQLAYLSFSDLAHPAYGPDDAIRWVARGSTPEGWRPA